VARRKQLQRHLVRPKMAGEAGGIVKIVVAHPKAALVNIS
jgi:hypothetical protein